MPIYDQGYRKYEAREALRRVRFWPITREALRLILAKRAFLGLLALSWLPFVGFVIYVFIVTQFAQAGQILPIDARLFARFLGFQVWPTLIVTVFGGAGLIANDLRTGGILVYLSRPLTRRDYVLGKLGVLLALNLSITLLPALLLYLVGLALAPAYLLKWSLAGIAPALVVYAGVVSLVVSLLAVAVSAASKSARVAGLGFFLLAVILDPIAMLVGSILRSPAASLLSIRANLETLGDALLGVAGGKLSLPWAYPALVLLALGLVCLAVLRSRVRTVEIVT